MTTQEPDEPNFDILPRDQTEHYKVELARLRAENDRLSSEVDYLRQALAASLSKIPQLEAPSASSPSTGAGSSAATSSPTGGYPPRQRWPWPDTASLRMYVRMLSLASIIASPVALLIVLGLALLCTIFFVSVYLSLTP